MSAKLWASWMQRSPSGFRADLMTVLEGSCHCGAVQFRIESDLADLYRCDCSLCRMKNAVMTTVHEHAFADRWRGCAERVQLEHTDRPALLLLEMRDLYVPPQTIDAGPLRDQCELPGRRRSYRAADPAGGRNRHERQGACGARSLDLSAQGLTIEPGRGNVGGRQRERRLPPSSARASLHPQLQTKEKLRRPLPWRYLDLGG